MNRKISHLDGWLYVIIGVCPILTAELSTEDATDLISKPTLFWTRFVLLAIGAAAGSGKTYRSTTFADKKDQDSTIDTAVKKVQDDATLAKAEVAAAPKVPPMTGIGDPENPKLP